MPVHLPEASYTSNQLADVVKAIETLEQVFSGYEIRFERINGVHSKKAEKTSRMPEAGSMRDRVLKATGQFATVPEIATATGIVKHKIRGVLNAPDIEFEKRDSGDGKQYKFVRFVKRDRTKKG